MSVSREQIYQALFALVTPLRAAGAIDGFPDGAGEGGAKPGTPTADRPFNCVTRDLIEVQRVPPQLQPVLIMYEFDELFTEDRYGLVSCEFKVGFMVGTVTKKGAVAQSPINLCADAVFAAIAPPPGEEIQNLGRLVDRVVPKGTGAKNAGSNSTADWRQGAYFLPVSIFLALGANQDG